MSETVAIDARGKACPQPVVMTLKALKAQAGPATVITTVDNEIAVSNLKKLGADKGLATSVATTAPGEFAVSFVVPEGTSVDGNPDELQCAPAPAAATAGRNVVVQLSSAAMGTGDDVLGEKLMASFVFSLTQLDELPTTILLYNGGAKLSCEGAATLEDLKKLAAAGVEILTCGTCLNHYGISDKLAVGEVTNMYVIAQKLTGASVVVRP